MPQSPKKLPVYLDNNATTALDPRVLEAMLPVLSSHFGNPASTTHQHGWFAAELVQIAREQVASLINATPQEIIFTSGATESNNLALKGLYNAQQLRNNFSLCTSAIEHTSVLDVATTLRQQGATTLLLPVNSLGLIEPSSWEKALESKPTLCSIMLANNEIGVLQDILMLASQTHQAGALFHSDAAQALGKISLDVRKLNVDLLSLSAHKLYGPKGIGALYIRQGEPRIALKSILDGGGHEQGFRAGTLNVPGIVGFGKACELAQQELLVHERHLMTLSQLLLQQLRSKIETVILNGSEEQRIPGNLNLAFPGISNIQLLAQISSKLSLSLTSACTSAQSRPSYVLQALGLSPEIQASSIRIGIGKFNTEEDIYFAADILTQAVKSLSPCKSL